MALKVLRQDWWLDVTALPDLRWARLSIHGDHPIEILDHHGQYHSFMSEEKAKAWFRNEEYEELSRLIKKGDVPIDNEPPIADSDFCSWLRPLSPS
jgi:hypothetical protein